jgi:hypothetical protein
MLQQRRGYNDIYATWGCPFPNSLQPTLGAQALTWDKFGAQLEAAGVNLLRVKFTGRNEPLNLSGIRSFELRAGIYNDWGGELQAFVDMCLAHGIGIHAIPFENEEWRKDDAWYQHAWNPRNGGGLADRANVLTDPWARDAAKRRIDAIAQMVGPAICSWEVCAELTYLFQQDFFGVDWAGLQRVVIDKGVPWVAEMVDHIHSVHSAPVGSGNVQSIGKKAEFKNEVHRVSGLDFALINAYGNQDVAAKFPEFRAAQAYTGLPVYVEQYAPWAIGGAGYVVDADPFPRSKAHEWAYACGEYGVVGPMRWPEAGGALAPAREWWGIAHPNMAAISGVTRHLAALVDLDDWTGRGQAWDGFITSPALTFVASWGDGRHCTAYCDWESGGSQRVQVDSLLGETCEVTTFDYLTGQPSPTFVVPIVDGSTSFDVPTTDTRAAFYVAAVDVVPSEVYTLRVAATLEADDMPVRTFEGVLQEVLP